MESMRAIVRANAMLGRTRLVRHTTPFFFAALISLAPPALADGHNDLSVDEPMEKTSTIAEAAASPAPQPSCEMDPNDPMLGFEAMDPMAFIDVPDGEPARATAVIEHWLVGRLSRQDIPAPLTKTFCQIGITNMITDYHHPVADDDAVIGVAYRAIYSWNAEAEFPGWQLTQLGLRMECARGMNMETKLCL